jgi:hypothetical protein
MSDPRFFRQYLNILDEQIVTQPPTSSIRHIVGANPEKDEYGEYNEPPPEGTPLTSPAVDPFANVPDSDPRMKITKGPAALQGQQQTNFTKIK